MIYKYLILFACFSIVAASANAQRDSISNTVSSLTNIDSKIINRLQKQYGSLQSKLDKQSARLLKKMQHNEAKLHAKLSCIDSITAQELFTSDIKQKYQELQESLCLPTNRFKRFPLKEYIPGVDSMQTALSFLIKSSHLPADELKELQILSTKFKQLEGQLQKANDIQYFIQERQAALTEQLMNMVLAKKLNSINKQVYYYQSQISTYKKLLNDKEKLKEKLLETVRTLPAFQKFWQKNSYLAALFPVPANSNALQVTNGLQTRASIQNLVAQRIATAEATGVNPQQYFQQSVDAAQAQFNQLKGRLNKFSNGNGSGNITMPDFKPNDQKTKSFFQRLEYGFNIQSVPGRYGLPTTTDFAMTIGYKLTGNKRVGIGTSYKLGWGNGIQDIHISNEGIGLRSYIDVKAKGSIWLSGGFEYNYLSSFQSIEELHNNVDVWQCSALMGFSKKYKIGKKEGNMQLLYDFLHNQQTPPGTALKFRVGYNF